MTLTERRLKHAKAKWDNELGRWQELNLQIYRLEKASKLQKDRVHTAYETYVKLLKEVSS